MPPWDDAVLVTPWNILHAKWNAAVLRKHCQKHQELFFVCQAENKVGKSRRNTTLEEMMITSGNQGDTGMTRKL